MGWFNNKDRDEKERALDELLSSLSSKLIQLEEELHLLVRRYNKTEISSDLIGEDLILLKAFLGIRRYDKTQKDRQVFTDEGMLPRILDNIKIMHYKIDKHLTGKSTPEDTTSG